LIIKIEDNVCSEVIDGLISASEVSWQQEATLPIEE
jgi:hypothetical protein